MTKQERALGYSVAMPVVVSSGKLPAVSGKLAMAVSGNACVGYIHSKADGAMSLCQLVATDGMVTVINSYLSDEKFSEASASYGTTSETFLVPSKSSASSGASGGNQNQNVTMYTLSISSNNEDQGTVDTSVNKQYASGSTVNIVATPKAGFAFDRWDDNTGGASRTVTMNSNITLKAYFKVRVDDDNDVTYGND